MVDVYVLMVGLEIIATYPLVNFFSLIHLCNNRFKVALNVQIHFVIVTTMDGATLLRVLAFAIAVIMDFIVKSHVCSPFTDYILIFISWCWSSM
jgi:hypothetical protein